jgi:TolB-like protein/Flp pilus assembly protein TadD
MLPDTIQRIGRIPMENTSSQTQPIRFGAFELDLRAGELRKQGVKIKLQEQPFQILSMLLDHPGQVVAREELRRKLWPSDTFVDFDHSLNKAVNKLREALGDSADSPRFIETLAKRGYRFIGEQQGTRDQIRSLLVLPLENLSPDPGQEYFADGLTEALITRLARIGALRVLSRTTSMHYKGVRKPLPEIAQELQVEGVVEGTVLRSGEQVRISTQLIHAPTDTHLWAESYDRDLRDVLGLQAEVAQAIAREIQVKLTPEEQTSLARARPVDPQAYETYLKGRYYWNRRTSESLNKASEFFQSAIEKDPSYAAAYAGLADARVVLGYWGFVPPREGAERAKTVALKAIEIDNTQAEAYASLGFATLHYDHDFLLAEQSFRRSIELNPRYATGRQWYAVYLTLVRRWEAALKEIDRAIHLDPISPILHVAYSGILILMRQWGRAIEEANRGLELDPASLQSLWMRGWACGLKGEHERGITELSKGVELSGGAALFVCALGYVYAAAGKPSAARKILEQLDQFAEQHYVMPYWKAMIYAALEEKDEAFRFLEEGYQEHSSWMAFLKVQPWFDNLLRDPRYKDLLRRMNFPP